MTNLSRFDPQLLFLFDILYKEKNASRAAVKLNMSQPGLAHKLNKLRHEWNDPLFVKVPGGLSATPKAHILAPKVEALVTQLTQFYQTLDEPSFLLRHESIVIHTTDYMEQKLLPILLPIVSQQTPNLSLIMKNTQGALPKKALDEGAADMAIAGFYSDLPETYRQKLLLEESFVVVFAKNNNVITPPLTLSQYTSCPHIITTLNGDLYSQIDAKLAEKNSKRNVIAGISSFISSAQMIKNSNFVVTCLESIAKQFVAMDNSLTYCTLPLEIPSVKIMLIWHERTHHDPLRSWLRKTIMNCLLEK